MVDDDVAERYSGSLCLSVIGYTMTMVKEDDIEPT